jgi:site-specific recombinase
MHLISALKKLFRKRKKYDTPNEFLLTRKEKEYLLIFFSVIGLSIVICIILTLL